ncbi:hypothetical protein GGS20DRAFT_228774 [Poronia punctata]|nr:hypothetical protein GGS20DRAFT_228774 [Poronia punctata]
MSERHDSHTKSTSTLREKGWAPTRSQNFPPPRAVNHYSSRALPPPPPPGSTSPRPCSSSSSIYNSEDGTAPETPTGTVTAANQAVGRQKRNTFGVAIDEEAFAMARPPQIKIPSRRHRDSHEHPDVISPRPQRPDSKLVSLWADGDELVSPIDTPGTGGWKNHVVSPLSDSSDGEMGFAADEVSSLGSDRSLEDKTQGRRPSSDFRENNKQLKHGPFLRAPRAQRPKARSRHSDPGSPFIAGIDPSEIGEPGPDIGSIDRIDDGSRQTSRRHPHALSMHSGDSRSRPRPHDKVNADKSHRVSFAATQLEAPPSMAPRASRRPPPPPPLVINERPVHKEYVGTPFMSPAESSFSPKPAHKPDEPSNKPQKRLSGLASIGTSFRSSMHKSDKSYPGFEDILDKIDNNQSQGNKSPAPKAKNILSKAKQGFGIGSSGESKKEKRREDLKRQIRLGNTE